MALCTGAFAADDAHNQPHSTRIMTFHFQEAVPHLEITAAIQEENRKKHIKRTLALKLLNRIQPDILGLQELHQGDVEYFKQNTAGYDWKGRPVRFVSGDFNDIYSNLSSFGKSGTDYNPIFYKSNTYECLESNAFWLNEGMVEKEDSRSWNIPNRSDFTVRACTYAKLKDARSQKTLWVFNTHLSLEVAIREKEMELIESQITKLAADNPTILIGNLNISDLEHYYIPERFIVSKNIAQEIINQHLGSEGSETFDHILLKNMPETTVSRYEVVDYADEYTQDGIHPSDHRPVFVDIME